MIRDKSLQNSLMRGSVHLSAEHGPGLVGAKIKQGKDRGAVFSSVKYVDPTT